MMFFTLAVFDFLKNEAFKNSEGMGGGGVQLLKNCEALFF